VACAPGHRLPASRRSPGLQHVQQRDKKTRPRRPQTNGKVKRYHRILLEEWATPAGTLALLTHDNLPDERS
jgi:transposase InsO family protein